ncbi:MAG: DUF1285 domain-containing protein [Nitrospirae bacterium]|nr:DUF1285 domain-containing protein [Nitrospirota bacterium]
MPALFIHDHADLTLAISPDGRWWVRGEPVKHPGVSRYLYKSLTRNEKGNAVVKAGLFEVPVTIADAAFIVNDIEIPGAGSGTGTVVLNDGSREGLHPETIRFSNDHVPYCKVREGRFEARFSRAAYYRLAGHIHFEADAYRLRLAGREFILSI